MGLTYLRNQSQAGVYIWQYDIIFMIALILSPSGQMLNIELRNAEPLNSLERQLPSSSENRLHIVGHNILAIFVSYVVAPVGSVNAPALPPTFSSRRGTSHCRVPFPLTLWRYWCWAIIIIEHIDTSNISHLQIAESVFPLVLILFSMFNFLNNDICRQTTEVLLRQVISTGSGIGSHVCKPSRRPHSTFENENLLPKSEYWKL